MFSLIGWVNNDEAGDLRRHRAHYDVIVMLGLSHDCLSASEETLKNMGKYITLIYLWHNKTQQNITVYFHEMYYAL